MSVQHTVARGLYNGLLYGAVPVAAPFFLVKGLVTGKYLPLLPERLGWAADAPVVEGDGVWIHAVSVGEVMVGRHLATALAEADGPPVTLSSTTAAGMALARKAAAAGDVAGAVAAPLDFIGAVRRSFDRVRPRLLVLVEGEIWPNWLAEAAARQIPVAVVNARVTERSLNRYRKFNSLFRPIHANIAAVGARTERDRERLEALGVLPTRIRVTGDIKFDVAPPGLERQEARRRFGLPDSDLVIVAGSTHPEENEIVLQAFRRFLAEHPLSVLVLAPRKSMSVSVPGLPVARRSVNETAVAGGVLLLDTIGELAQVYAAGDIAFVGGSLVAIGGHNLLEAAAASIPVTFGPHTDHFEVPARRLIESGGGIRVTGGEQLTEEWLRLAGEPDERRTAGEAARRVVEDGRGGTEETVEMLRSLL